MRDVEDAVEIDGNDIFPILDHGVAIAGKGVAAVDAGIVDKDRDLPDLLTDALGERNAVFAPGDVELEAGSLAARAADFFRGLCRRSFVDIDQRDLRAFARVTESNRPADAGGSARNGGDMVLEQARHHFLRVLFFEA